MKLQRRLLARAVPVALVISSLGGAISTTAGVRASGASVARTASGPVTEKGKLVKVLTPTSFTMSVGTKHYTVKIEAMTHAMMGTKTVTLSSLKVGDSMTVKGTLDKSTINATSVTAS